MIILMIVLNCQLNFEFVFSLVGILPFISATRSTHFMLLVIVTEDSLNDVCDLREFRDRVRVVHSMYTLWWTKMYASYNQASSSLTLTTRPVPK